MIAQRDRMLVAAVLMLVLGLPFALPNVAAAGGVGIYPVQIELDEALRGAEYLRTVTVVNQEAGELSLHFITDGEIATWLTIFEPTQPDIALSEFVVPPVTETRLTLRVAVPADAPNGRYTGDIRFQGSTSGDAGDQSGVGVSIGIAAAVTVDVTGAQNLTGNVLDLWVDDAEVDQPPLRLRMQFQNDGNVEARPIVSWRIVDANGGEVADLSFDDAVVQPDFVETFNFEWDHSGLSAGDYRSVVAVQLGDALIAEQELSFELLPPGTLTRAGLLERIMLEGDPQPGGVAKVVGVFRNTGQIDTRAVLMAEIYHNEQFIQTVTSLERVVVIGELALLEVFMDVPEAGTYRVLGKVNYEGRETEVREAEFTVVAAAPTAQAADIPTTVPVEALTPAEQTASASSETSLGVWLLVGAVALLVGGVLAVFVGRRFGRSGARRGAASGASGQTRSSEL